MPPSVKIRRTRGFCYSDLWIAKGNVNGGTKTKTLKGRARICKRLWKSGIDSEEEERFRQAANRFLGSFKKGLQIGAQVKITRRSIYFLRIG
jgi:hypothetical protein